MENVSLYENLFMKADALISDGNSSEAKEILEDILAQCPDFGKAHNHLGWIHYNKLSNYDKGIYHYKLAMKFEPKYSASYLNYAYLLVDLGRYKEAKEHIDFAIKTLENVDYCNFYSELGRIYELEGNYILAHNYYEKSKKLAFNPQFIENMKTNIKRVYEKMSIFEKLKIKFN
ncbi:MAG: tetratricopeptide repeat protein [Flavobacterium sp.]|nr:tetratricopeptide repeat protein [Flavobacterium sp.]